MDKLTLQNYREQKLSLYQIADKEGKSYTCVKYWMQKHGLSTKRIACEKCKGCGGELTGNQLMYCSTKCKNLVCNSVHQIYEKQQERGLKRKLDLIRLRGSKCEKCGYSKNLAALQFHHINPDEKESQMDMRKLSNSKWEWCLAELDKCLVLCGNCHAETHHPHLDLEKLVVDAGSAPDASTDHAL